MKNILTKLSQKQIGLIGVMIAIIKLLFIIAIAIKMPIGALYVLNVLKGITIGIATLGHWSFSLADERYFVDLFDLFFTLTLLIGSVMYIITNGVKIYLFRFCIFVGLIAAIPSAIYMINALLFTLKPYHPVFVIFYVIGKGLFFFFFLFSLSFEKNRYG